MIKPTLVPLFTTVRDVFLGAPPMARSPGRTHLPWLLCAHLAAAACARPDFEPGGECELNTECAASLVCRLGRCRVECRAQRDCPLGLDCVRDPDGLGACQLPSEASCTLASDCADPFLVCRHGRCTNACETNRDCPPGARCEADESGMRGCRDAYEDECMLNSHCDAVDARLICAPDHRCREQCHTDRDCRDGTVCLDTMSPTVCGPPEMRPDAGFDGGALDAGALDAGGTDAGGTDAGTDAGAMAALPPGPPHMGGGLDHTCAFQSATDLRCWGGNTDGQIGNGGTSDAPTPFRHALGGVSTASGGASHSCATSVTGLSCWGANDRGQLGTGAAGGPRTSPAAVVGLPATPSDLALGSDHTCAIASSNLYCWGDNQAGQLGLGMIGASAVATPSLVALPAAASQVATFGSTTCAIVADGRVYCWGENGFGQVGHGVAGADVPTPTEIVAVRGATHVSSGTTHTCAVVGGGVMCWGSNLLGQLGNDTIPVRSPVPVAATTAPADPAITVPTQLALGSTHTCLRTSAEVFCWGDNAQGRCGLDDALMPEIRTPKVVPSLGRVDEIAAGLSHTCARTGATLLCFGSNQRGQLGDGTSGGDDWMPRTVLWP